MFLMIKKIKIKKGIFYKVILDDEIEKADYGYCISGDRLIGIRPGLSRRVSKATLIHEVIHAMDFEWNIQLTEEQTLLLESAIVKLLDLNNLKPYLK